MAEQNEEILLRLRNARQLLTALVRSEGLSGGDVERMLRQITEVATKLLQVERAGVWCLDRARTTIACLDLFQRSTLDHTQGMSLGIDEAPEYFRALGTDRYITASDAYTDPRTRELVDSYLRPGGIGAMLDAPIWVGGETVGVVCHEHVGGARTWDLVDELLAGVVADFVARILETQARVRAEEALGRREHHTAMLVQLRRAELERIEVTLEREEEQRRTSSPDVSGTVDHLKEMFHASPVALVLASLEDTKVVYANARARDLFDMGGGELVGHRLVDFYVLSGDGETLNARLRDEGRIRGTVTHLKSAAGRSFWALMTAQRVTYEERECAVVAFADITAQKIAEQAVRESEQNIRLLFEAAPVPLVLTRVADQRVLMANPRATELFSLSPDEVFGQHTPDYYVRPTDRDAIVQELNVRGSVSSVLTELRTHAGKTFWALVSARAIEFAGNRCFLVGISDVTEQKEVEEQLRELSIRDPLTGVYNRRYFVERSEVEIQRVDRTKSDLALCIIDADHFKAINDEHGHMVGDRVLQELAATCARELRAPDLLARIGGEEFAILFPDTDLLGAQKVAERIRARVEALAVKDDEGQSVKATVSIGVASRDGDQSVSSLLRAADDALYRAKEGGRNRVA